jgi:hypothetical protein
MRCVDAANPNSQPFDIPSGLARVLINQKLVTEYLPPKPKSAPARFGVGYYSDRKPMIVATCDGCKQTFRFEGQEPKCMKVSHCGLTELVPADVAAAYLEARDLWQPTEKPEYESRPARQREHVTSF